MVQQTCKNNYVWYETGVVEETLVTTYYLANERWDGSLGKQNKTKQAKQTYTQGKT